MTWGLQKTTWESPEDEIRSAVDEFGLPEDKSGFPAVDSEPPKDDLRLLEDDFGPPENELGTQEG